MDRRKFLKTLAISAIASAVPLGATLSSPNIKFSREYALAQDAWILRGSITDGDCMYAVDIKHKEKDDLDMLEEMIRTALNNR